MSLIYACDPGVNGAVAFFKDGALRQVVRNADFLVARCHPCDRAYLEHVHGQPRDTPTTAFGLGASFGALRQELNRMCEPENVYLIRPQLWQQKIGVPIGMEYNDRKRWVKDWVNQTLNPAKPHPLWAADAIAMGLAMAGLTPRL